MEYWMSIDIEIVFWGEGEKCRGINGVEFWCRNGTTVRNNINKEIKIIKNFKNHI